MIVNVPGIGGSGETHWQTRWEARAPEVLRIAPGSWDAPELDDWVAALDRVVARVPATVIVATASAVWSSRRGRAGVR